MTRKRTGPFISQVNLANRSRGLLIGKAQRALIYPQWAHAGGYGTGRDDDDVSGFHAFDYSIHDAVNLVARDRKILFGQRGRTNLYNDSVRGIDLRSQGSFWQQV